MLFIDHYAYNNKLGASHPLERFIFAIATMLITLAAGKIVISILTIMLMLWLLIVTAKVPWYVVGKLMLIPLSFLLVGIITIAFVINTSSVGMLMNIKVGGYYLGFTEASYGLAINTFFKSLSSLSCLYFLILTTPMIQLIYVLEILRIPKVICELMIVIYRFIFVFLDVAYKIYIAQSSRWGYSSFKRSLRSFGALFANLWGKAFIKSQNLYTGLTSRGYENELKVLNPKYKFSKEYISLFGIIDIILIGITFILGGA